MEQPPKTVQKEGLKGIKKTERLDNINKLGEMIAIDTSNGHIQDLE